MRPPPLPKRRKQEEEIAGTPEVEIEEEEKTSVEPSLDAAAIQDQIAKMMGYSTFEPEYRFWLDSGSPELNAVLGSREKGLPYGKIYELSGEEHGGKTTLATVLAGMAQKEGAGVGYIDLEDSRDEDWAGKLGLDLNATVKVYPKLITGKAKRKKKDEEHDEATGKMLKRFGLAPRLQSAEDMFEEAEAGMAILAKQGFEKQFWFLDSIANLQTEMVIDAGVKDQNMRTRLDRAQFLSQTLPRWAGLAANYNATIFLLNQLRDKQGMVFGKRTYSTGGRALRHACAIRAEVKRRKGGKVLKNGQTIGILGTIVNEKNKAGGGSVQNEKCAFKIVWTKNPARVSFMSISDLEEDGQ